MNITIFGLLNLSEIKLLNKIKNNVEKCETLSDCYDIILLNQNLLKHYEWDLILNKVDSIQILKNNKDIILEIKKQ